MWKKMKEYNVIETKDLTKYYGKIKALDNLNINIKRGEIYGLLGPNGAGKTTVVRILNCIIRPTSGTARILGFNLLKEMNEIKRATGYLPESPALYQKLTSIEYLEYVGNLYFIPENILKARIEELLELFELKKRKNDLIEEYSMGMKQKVCLCAALIQDPPLIFLDEPTSNLDPAASRMVKDLITMLVKDAEKTIFMCTHLLDVAKELCNRIGIINEGKLESEGTLNEIISSKNADNLEDAYLKILGISKMTDLLSWRKLN
jgi:ABC-2 type transport system ATP-binding protein